nr:hypothetical protein [uncultured Fusobacterium sp.]
MEAAQKSGCSGILIDFESLKRESLEEINKRGSNVEKYKKRVERAHKYNIAINGCFILGILKRIH